ncbi:CHASE3 domain-containing protein [Microcoleus sp. POL8_C6]|uniref:CHASE3 domain-containing protein n=1 Tax=Microcoleus sp. Pol8_C1 TaxID=2818896 RepID=UPI002FCFBC3A
MAVALLILNAATLYRNTLKLVENERWVSHTHKVLTELETTLSTLKDAKTGQQGYLVRRK